MKPHTKLFFISISLLLAIVSCGGAAQTPESNPEPKPVPEGTTQEQVQFLVDADRYTEALDILREQDSDEPEIRTMQRDVHLLYGVWLVDHAQNMDMRVNMPEALRQFRRVLELDPDNRIAQANIQQIETIYKSLNREIPQGVAQ
jgi:hypothetical protein